MYGKVLYIYENVGKYFPVQTSQRLINKAIFILILKEKSMYSNPVHTSTFLKTSVFGYPKMDKKPCVHTSVFTSFSTVHTRSWKTMIQRCVFVTRLCSFDTHAPMAPATLLVLHNELWRKRFWKAPFLPSTLKRPAFSKISTLESVFENLRFHR